MENASTSTLLMDGPVQVQQRSLSTEITFSRHSPLTPSMSIGRNGEIQTTGLMLSFQGRYLDIAPITSRNKVGRASVAIPKDLDHLKALKAALGALINDIETKELESP